MTINTRLHPQYVMYRRLWRDRHPYIFAGVFVGAVVVALAAFVALVAWLAG